MLDDDFSDEPSWVADWKIFLDTKLQTPFPDDLEPEDDDGRDNFIAQALKAFSDKFQFATLALPAENQEEALHE